MDPRLVIRSQYLASLEMLKQAIEKCPAEMWNDPADHNRFWQIAYHGLFYVHLYLQTRRELFQAWEKHQKGWERYSTLDPVCTQEIMLGYLAFCQGVVREKTADLDLEAESGFHWLPFNKLELQFYNIRHLQLHTGELMDRLGSRAHVDVDWVSLQHD